MIIEVPYNIGQTGYYVSDDAIRMDEIKKFKISSVSSFVNVWNNITNITLMDMYGMSISSKYFILSKEEAKQRVKENRQVVLKQYEDWLYASIIETKSLQDKIACLQKLIRG